MSFRAKPFGEWVIVYYDAAQTDPEKLLKRLRTNGCNTAKQVAPVSARQDQVEVTVANPLATPGDFFHIEVALPEGRKGKVELAAPRGWTVPDGASRELKERVTRCDVQTGADAVQGRQELTFKVRLENAAAVELKVQVELIKRQLR